MHNYLQALCSPQTWFFTIIMTVGVIGLAKSWDRYKKMNSAGGSCSQESGECHEKKENQESK
jgi:hypothetical protein